MNKIEISREIEKLENELEEITTKIDNSLSFFMQWKILCMMKKRQLEGYS